MGSTPSVAIVSRSVPQPESSNAAVAYTFWGLQLFALAGSSLILFTVLFFSTVKRRHPLLLNFIVTWIISCITYILIVGVPLDEKPGKELCFAQAVLVYSVPTLTAASATALVIHVLITIRSVITTSPWKHDTISTMLLIVIPYAIALGMMTVSLLVGMDDPSTVGRSDTGGMYCTMENRMPSRVSAIVVTAIMVGCVVMEVVIAVLLWGHWSVLQRTPRSHSMTLRVLAYSVFGIITLAMSIMFSITRDRNPATNLILGFLPVVAVFTFGSQRDILRTWKWIITGKKPQRPTEPELSNLPDGHTSTEPITTRALHNAGTEQIRLSLLVYSTSAK